MAFLPLDDFPMPTLSQVELAALAEDTSARYPDENIPSLVVDNFPALGRLTAMRFVEWASTNPEGVVSLPTGKTPEHFIRWVERIRARWNDADVQADAAASGLELKRRPDFSGLRFVQIDEFYPMNPMQENSFYHYVNRFYLTPSFGLSPDRALLMDNRVIGLDPGDTLEKLWPDAVVDLDLRHRAPKSHLEEAQQAALSRIDQWCQEFEDRIRQLGGIGFFLGGIGPDGHVGFNVRGASHYSTTRLAPTNYETQAAAATDLGGIEISRRRLVITIGLGTITFNPNAVAVIMAAGEAKAQVVADAILSRPDVRYPGTALHKLPNARFYLTAGAARLLPSRMKAQLEAVETLEPAARDRLVIDLSLKLHKPLAELTSADFTADPAASALLKHHAPAELPGLARALRDELCRRIESGSTARKNTRFLHTEPHHDDIMLGYLTPLIRHTRDASNEHWFATLTSGFTSVTNDFLRSQAEQASSYMDSDDFIRLTSEQYFDGDRRHRDRDVWQFLDGIAAGDPEMAGEGEARRFLRDLAAHAGSSSRKVLRESIRTVLDYLGGAYPGQKDPPNIQTLKGMRREWEVECLWGYLGWSTERIRHLRMGFYTGDIFTKEPSLERDVPPVAALLEETRPDVVTVALDPEASGPDTHYKTLQAVAAALRQYADRGLGSPEIWGYRNIWFRFHPADANRWTPVSLNMLATMEKAFLSAFASQRAASFPSYELDGPFSDLARRIQVEQYQMAKTLLGRQWFQEHPSPLIRAARAFVFTRTMGLDAFTGEARELRRAAENL